VQIYDLGEKDGAFYIAMEYLPGEHLAAVVRGGNKAGRPLPMTYSVRLIASAADGLGYAHGRIGMDGKPLNIVHRDVSPQNLIVTYDGAMKVVDFGIAKAANRVSRTSDGKFKGKAAYMSPEQARGEPLDGRSDVFALGVVLFEMVTHSRLFQFDDPIAAFHAIAGDAPYPTARERNPEVPASLDAIIARALNRDLSKRFQSAKELQAALEEWLRKRDDAPTTADIGEYMSSVFEERIRQRDRLLEAASQGDVGRATVTASTSLGEDTERSMPGAGSIAGFKVRKPHVWVASLAGLALLAGVAVLYPRASSGTNTPPAPAPHVLVVDTEPPKARITIDGQYRGEAGLTLNDLSLGEHTLQAELDGYTPSTRVVKLSTGERQNLVLTLTPVPKPPPPEPIAATSPDGGVPEPAVGLNIAPNPEEAGEREEPTRKASRGQLTLDTTPWTNVYLNGRKLGETPLLKVSVPAGRQTLQLVNEEEGIKKRIEVEIEPGKTTVKRMKL
jgi:serine/threonine-protein kinase